MADEEKEAITLWLGYSWFLGPIKSHLCVTVFDGVKTIHYPLSWDSDLRPTSPPTPGISDTMGISGVGAYLFNSQSKLSSEEEEWRVQVQKLERGFERLLADVLQGIVSDTLETYKDRKLYFVIQGPAFPKLLGRLSYRHLRNSKKKVSFYFMTFRRRFLTPSPLLKWEKSDKKFNGMIHGPLPSNHEESIVKRYYILPKNEEVLGRFCPLMVEFFHQNEPLPSDNAEMANFLSQIGLRATPKFISVDAKKWDYYPDAKAFQVVMVPAPLLIASKASNLKLHRLLGERDDILARKKAEELGAQFMSILRKNKDEEKRDLTFIAAREEGKEPDSKFFIDTLEEAFQKMDHGSV